MENKSHALAAGAFVLALAALLTGLAMWLMRDVANTVTYQMTSSAAVTGLQVQAPVRYKGVAVGKVTAIGFDPAEQGNVLVTMAIAPDAPVGDGTYATLGFQGVTGLSFVQLDDNGEHGTPLPPGPGGVPRIPLKPNLLGALTDRAEGLMDKLGELADGMQQILSPQNQAAVTRALQEIGSAAQSVSRLAANADKTLHAQFNPQNGAAAALIRQSAQTMQSAADAAQRAQRMADEWRALAQGAQKTLDSVAGPQGPLQRIGNSADALVAGTLPRIQTLADDASQTMQRLQDTATRIGDNPQQLIYGHGSVPPGPGEAGFQPPAPSPAN